MQILCYCVKTSAFYFYSPFLSNADFTVTQVDLDLVSARVTALLLAKAYNSHFRAVISPV